MGRQMEMKTKSRNLAANLSRHRWGRGRRCRRVGRVGRVGSVGRVGGEGRVTGVGGREVGWAVVGGAVRARAGVEKEAGGLGVGREGEGQAGSGREGTAKGA